MCGVCARVCVRVCMCVCVPVYPAVKMGTWWSGANWGSSPPSYNINGYLVYTREANAQLSMSHIAVEDPGGTLGAHTITCETWYSLLRVTSPAPGGHACIVPE